MASLPFGVFLVMSPSAVIKSRMHQVSSLALPMATVVLDRAAALATTVQAQAQVTMVLAAAQAVLAHISATTAMAAAVLVKFTMATTAI